METLVHRLILPDIVALLLPDAMALFLPGKPWHRNNGNSLFPMYTEIYGIGSLSYTCFPMYEMYELTAKSR